MSIETGATQRNIRPLTVVVKTLTAERHSPPSAVVLAVQSDPAARLALFEAAHVIMTRVAKRSALKSWAVRVAQRRGAKRGKVALARKLAVVLHRMWVSETGFRYATANEA